MLPQRLTDIEFHGGEVCYAVDLHFEASLEAEAARLGEGLDLQLAEIFYWRAKFVLDLGWEDISGTVDASGTNFIHPGRYPAGEFVLRLRAGSLTLRQWQTRDLRQLRRYILQARDRAALLHPRRDLPTELLVVMVASTNSDAEAILAHTQAFLKALLPAHRLKRSCRQDSCVWYACPPLSETEAEPLRRRLWEWSRSQPFAAFPSADGWNHDLT